MHDEHHDHASPSAEDASHDHSRHSTEARATGTAGYHPHESPWTMLVPLAVLSIGAIAAGQLFHHAFLDAEHGAEFWAGSIAWDAHLMHAMHEVPKWVKWAPFAVMALGLYLAWNSYIRNPAIPTAFVARYRDLHAFLLNKWYFDELYDLIFVRPALWFGRLFWKGGDENIIDRFGPNGLAASVAYGSRIAVRFQSGYLYSYAFVMLLGLAALATWVVATN